MSVGIQGHWPNVMDYIGERGIPLYEYIYNSNENVPSPPPPHTNTYTLNTILLKNKYYMVSLKVRNVKVFVVMKQFIMDLIDLDWP